MVGSPPRKRGICGATRINCVWQQVLCDAELSSLWTPAISQLRHTHLRTRHLIMVSPLKERYPYADMNGVASTRSRGAFHWSCVDRLSDRTLDRMFRGSAPYESKRQYKVAKTQLWTIISTPSKRELLFTDEGISPYITKLVKGSLSKDAISMPRVFLLLLPLPRGIQIFPLAGAGKRRRWM